MGVAEFADIGDQPVGQFDIEAGVRLNRVSLDSGQVSFNIPAMNPMMTMMTMMTIVMMTMGTMMMTRMMPVTHPLLMVMQIILDSVMMGG